MEIASDARMGLVELSVSDLDRSLAYWQEAIGLRMLSREDGTAELGTDSPLLRLVEEPGARPADGFTGLYHVALLVPDRPSLARFLAHAARERIPLEGLSDHAVSEAIYLRDPDRHGIEVYADRPREQWEGQVGERLTTGPLDADSLLAEARRRLVRGPAGRDDGRPRPPPRARRRRGCRLLPRHARPGADGPARADRPPSSAPAATTITSARTRWETRGARLRRPGPARSAPRDDRPAGRGGAGPARRRVAGDGQEPERRGRRARPRPVRQRDSPQR